MTPDANISDSATPEAKQLSAVEKVRRLLDVAPPEEFQSEWTKFYAAEKNIIPPVTHSLVIFRLGNEWLALATKAFQEIAGRSPIHSLPHAKKEIVLGLVRVRGELLITVSLAALLGINSTAQQDTDSRKVRFIVLNKEGDRFVFPADEVYGVHRLAAELQPVPSTVANAAATYTRGLFHWQNKIVGCLDEQLLFHSLNRSLS
ncbi:MAG: cheW [Verrucomicrobiales bacterium]|nr:cheW [Verrucomicrobiales bacterium]